MGCNSFYHNPLISSEIYGGIYHSDNGFLISPHLYITHQFSPRFWLALGYTDTANYYQFWGDDPSPTNPVPQYISFLKTNTHSISPALIFKWSENVSIGFGLHYALSSLELKKWDADGIDELLALRTGISTSRVDVSSVIDLSGDDLSYFAGLHWQVTPTLMVGITYHHGSDLDGQGMILPYPPLKMISLIMIWALFFRTRRLMVISKIGLISYPLA